jgi:hypothetical protein
MRFNIDVFYQCTVWSEVIAICASLKHATHDRLPPMILVVISAAAKQLEYTQYLHQKRAESNMSHAQQTCMHSAPLAFKFANNSLTGGCYIHSNLCIHTHVDMYNRYNVQIVGATVLARSL